MGQPREVGLAQAGAVVQRDAVQVRDADDDAERVPRGAAPDDGHGVGEAEGAPDELRHNARMDQHAERIDAGRTFAFRLWGEKKKKTRLTAVMVSMLSMKKSDVRYRESDSAYSFHSCASTFCDDAMVAWLRTK